MASYYNDNDPYAADWLRSLIAEGLIPPGDVDERSIADVKGSDLAGYTQCHFFAGIGGWPLALQLAGWPSTRPVFTGSCPCQPFSSAGSRKREADERHLWPEFRRLIAEYRPGVVFGEQVASDIGRTWSAGVRADLEDLAYAVGIVDLCAAGLGAPHIRQRLYWLADSDGGSAERHGLELGGAPREVEGEMGERKRVRDESINGSIDNGLADADGGESSNGGLQRGGELGLKPQGSRTYDGVADAYWSGQSTNIGPERSDWDDTGRGGSRLADSSSGGRGQDNLAIWTGGTEQPPRASGVSRQATDEEIEGGRRTIDQATIEGSSGGLDDAAGDGTRRTRTSIAGGDGTDDGLSGPTGPWDNSEFVLCADGQTRRIESGLLPLVDGVPFRLADGRTNEAASRPETIRGLGNAIVPPVAAEFIKAYMTTREGL
jgi:DNA (cytosine-5)-methyltransferase 1